MYWQKAVCHGQTMFFKILQYVSLTQPQPAQVSYPWIRSRFCFCGTGFILLSVLSVLHTPNHNILLRIKGNSPHALGCHGVVGVHFSCSVFPSWSLEKQKQKGSVSLCINFSLKYALNLNME